MMQADVEPVATSLEVVTPLELERSVFDSAEVHILSTAFEKAWAYVEFDPTLGILDVSERQSELARCLMAILKLGETNPTSLANSGIALLRRSQRGLLPPHRPRHRANRA
jgi:hypothetical protein